MIIIPTLPLTLLNPKTIDDVEAFFRHLYDVEKVAFHPDDSFHGYIEFESQKATYTPAQATLRDNLMKRAFEIANKSGINIYSLGMAVQDDWTFQQIKTLHDKLNWGEVRLETPKVRLSCGKTYSLAQWHALLKEEVFSIEDATGKDFEF